MNRIIVIVADGIQANNYRHGAGGIFFFYLCILRLIWALEVKDSQSKQLIVASARSMEVAQLTK
jgi:hypothetical protein